MNNKTNKKKNKQHQQQQQQQQQKQKQKQKQNQQSDFELEDIEEAELDIIEDPLEQLDQTEELNQINQYQLEQFIQQQKQELSLLPPPSLQPQQPQQPQQTSKPTPLKTVGQHHEKKDKEIVLGWIEKSILSNIYPTNPIGQLVLKDKNTKNINNRELSLFLSDKVSTIRINFSEESLRATFEFNSKNSLSVGNLAGCIIEIQNYRISPDITYSNFVLYIYKFSIISKVKIPNIPLIPISKQTKIVHLLNLKREMINVKSHHDIIVSFSESIISPDQSIYLDSIPEWKSEQPQILSDVQFEEGSLSQMDSDNGSGDKNNSFKSGNDKVIDFQYEYSGDEIDDEVGVGNQAINQLLASIKEKREKEDKNKNTVNSGGSGDNLVPGKRKFREFENDEDEFAELLESVQQQQQDNNEPPVYNNHLENSNQNKIVEDDNQLDENLFDDFQPSSFIDLEKSNNNKNSKINITMPPKKNSLTFEKYNPQNQPNQQQQNKTLVTAPSLIKTTSVPSNTTTTTTSTITAGMKPIILKPITPTVPIKPTKNITPATTSAPSNPTTATTTTNNNNNNINQNGKQIQQTQQINNDFEIFNLQLGIKSSNGLDINKSMRFLLEDQSCKHVIEVGGLEIVIKRKRNIE